MEWLVNVVAFCLVLLLVVPVHEFCHLLFGKLFGVKVRQFSIGFPPKLWSIKIGETEYCISALPLGGYVKLAGHGESKEECKNEKTDQLFYSKPVWKRLVIVAAGPLSNLLLAVLLFSSVYYVKGNPAPTTVLGVVTDEYPAAKAGLKIGDKILSINNQEVKWWEDLSFTLGASDGNAAEITVLRSGKKLHFTIQPELKE